MTDEFSLLYKVNNGEIKPTGAKPKLPLKLDGLDSENLNVYRIPLDMLSTTMRMGVFVRHGLSLKMWHDLVMMAMFIMLLLNV